MNMNVTAADRPEKGGRMGFTNLIAWPSYVYDRQWTDASGVCPSSTERVVDENGEVDYMHLHIPGDGTDSDLLWRGKLGSFIARYILELKGATTEKLLIDEFPANYRLYTHFKGPAHTPRSDQYLYGVSGKIFRSPAEFALHAIWLWDGQPKDDPCQCPYCGHHDSALQKRIREKYFHMVGTKQSKRGRQGGEENRMSLHNTVKSRMERMKQQKALQAQRATAKIAAVRSEEDSTPAPSSPGTGSASSPAMPPLPEIKDDVTKPHTTTA
jgi:hypothetical protein